MSDKLTIEKLENIILKSLRANREKLFDKDREIRQVLKRAIIFHFLKKYTTLTWVMIGDRYNRHHSTVITAYKNFDVYMKSFEYFRNKVNELNEKLEGTSKIIVCNHCGREL